MKTLFGVHAQVSLFNIFLKLFLEAVEIEVVLTVIEFNLAQINDTCAWTPNKGLYTISWLQPDWRPGDEHTCQQVPRARMRVLQQSWRRAIMDYQAGDG